MPDLDAAADFLVAARHRGRPGPRLPDACRPADIATAWLIRDRVTARLGQAVGGWKCGLPKQDRISAAPIYAPGITRMSPVVMAVSGQEAEIEPEIAFVLRQDLPPAREPFERAAIEAAIGSTHLALELIGCRYENPTEASYPEIFADGLMNQGVFVGPEIAFPPPSDMALEITAASGVLLRRDGRHPDGDPVAPVLWLANELGRRGGGLTKGQVIITGSFAGIIPVPNNTGLHIRFGTLGEIAVTFIK